MTNPMEHLDWQIYRGSNRSDGDIGRLPESPKWRRFRDDDAGNLQLQLEKGQKFKARPDVIAMVNAALYLRRPLLITGNPGTGKSSLAYAVAYELNLGAVLKWSITTRTTLKDGLYSYDAIARLQNAQLLEYKRRLQQPPTAMTDSTPTPPENREDIGDYITLGPLGTAFALDESDESNNQDKKKNKPRVLLIDEIDKSDIDLPNDLLNIFEDGEFSIPELQRIKTTEVEVQTADRIGENQKTAKVRNGVVRCREFPLVIMTSNNERDFPPPFLRRCLRLEMKDPSLEELSQIVSSHLGEEAANEAEVLIGEFFNSSQKGTLATDQLLNTIALLTGNPTPSEHDRKILKEKLLQYLNSSEGA
jgi:MoxR-like ATPase